ncbi:hypothetical protein Pyrfu_0536 [Pyrolobus fumarii 1A]|uniref:Uncharacterized protein n=1 Tax=Pyrolobus fumarii (strain DSM 11204 / 1A) TaxID=694429 RepID=G0EGN3_PYRF1|nr:hypothetical protein Pyrfu_0536 [Pyrolobus fumarii 1A]
MDGSDRIAVYAGQFAIQTLTLAGIALAAFTLALIGLRG